MDINAAFPSKYVKAADLQGQDVTLTMMQVVLESVEGEKDPLPVLYFTGMTKGMVLNKTNGNTIAGLYGPETDHWAGQSITVFPTTTDFGGKPVACIRVRSVPSAPQPPVPLANSPLPVPTPPPLPPQQLIPPQPPGTSTVTF